jgi:glycosyltransferase involved in cell wall biosynthesis
MDSDATSIINALIDVDGPYDLALHERLHQFLIPLKAAAHQQGEDCGPVVNLLRHGVATRDLLKRILIASALGDITGEAEWFDRLFEDAASPALSFEARHALFVHIGVSLFQNRGRIGEAEHFRLEQVRLRALFLGLVDEMEAALARSSLARSDRCPVEGRVVILTPQVLAPPHATTMRTLEYATSLIDDFGKTPVIVESHPFPRTSPVAFVPYFSSNRNDTLGAVETLDVGGRAVEYFKIAPEVLGLSDLVDTAALIAALAPELVIAISTPYLAAEAAALVAPTFCQPTTASLPIVRRAGAFAWAEPSPEQSALMQRLGVKDQSLFHMPPGFSLPDEHPAVTRAELGLPEDGFVFAVVGGRLDDEVDARFLDLLEAICADPRAHIAMMGRFEGFDAVLALRPKLAGRVSFLGYRLDILSVLRVCDTFLNPDRTGGGRSGAYAQYVGLPVLSLGRGDVAAAIGPERCCGSYEEMADEATRLVGDPHQLQRRRAEATAHRSDAIGVRSLMARILAEVSSRRPVGA